MFHPWHDVTPAVEDRELPLGFRAVIEIPKGSVNKYELDKKSGMLKLDRTLSSAVYYPANYGFIPQTLAQDDDPLDVLVFASTPIEPMCICSARPVGVMEMVDEGAPDHKIVSVLTGDPEYAELRDAGDFPKHTFKMLKRFFEDYKQLEGKEVAVDEIQPVAKAHEILEDCLLRYSKVRRRGQMEGLI